MRDRWTPSGDSTLRTPPTTRPPEVGGHEFLSITVVMPSRIRKRALRSRLEAQLSSARSGGGALLVDPELVERVAVRRRTCRHGEPHVAPGVAHVDVVEAAV